MPRPEITDADAEWLAQKKTRRLYIRGFIHDGQALFADGTPNNDPKAPNDNMSAMPPADPPGRVDDDGGRRN